MIHRLRPPHVIHTARLRLRCLRPGDAPALLQAITESLDHLRPYMPWAAEEPGSLEQKTRLLRKFYRNFILGRDFCYGIHLREHGRNGDDCLIGSCGMHPRIGCGAVELGYWIHTRHVSCGYATEAAAALTRIAFIHPALRRVEIHCDTRNLASAAVARKLGYTHMVTVNSCITSATSPIRDMMIFVMSRPEFSASAAAIRRLGT